MLTTSFKKLALIFLGTSGYIPSHFAAEKNTNHHLFYKAHEIAFKNFTNFFCMDSAIKSSLKNAKISFNTRILIQKKHRPSYFNHAFLQIRSFKTMVLTLEQTFNQMAVQLNFLRSFDKNIFSGITVRLGKNQKLNDRDFFNGHSNFKLMRSNNARAENISNLSTAASIDKKNNQILSISDFNPQQKAFYEEYVSAKNSFESLKNFKKTSEYKSTEKILGENLEKLKTEPVRKQNNNQISESLKKDLENAVQKEKVITSFHVEVKQNLFDLKTELLSLSTDFKNYIETCKNFLELIQLNNEEKKSNDQFSLFLNRSLEENTNHLILINEAIKKTGDDTVKVMKNFCDNTTILESGIKHYVKNLHNCASESSLYVSNLNEKIDAIELNSNEIQLKINQISSNNQKIIQNIF